MLCSRPPQAGHLKPSGHRDATITARHCSSLPYCRSNAGSLSPFWNCTALRAISIPPPKALVCSWFVPYPGRLSKVHNQVVLWGCRSGGPPGSSPRWPGDFFKKLQRLRVLGIVTRASRELAIAERAQFPAQRRLAERDPKLLPDPHCEILQPPANHAVDRRHRPTLDDVH